MKNNRRNKNYICNDNDRSNTNAKKNDRKSIKAILKSLLVIVITLMTIVSFSVVQFSENSFAAAKNSTTSNVTKSEASKESKPATGSNAAAKSNSTGSNAAAKSNSTGSNAAAKSNSTGSNAVAKSNSTGSNAVAKSNSSGSNIATKSDVTPSNTATNSNASTSKSNSSKTSGSRISIKNYKIILDNYIAYYDGSDKTPSIKKVYYDKSDNKISSKYRTLKEKNYSVKYYTMEMKSEGVFSPGEEVKSIVDKGEYYIAVTGSGTFKGTAYQAFSVLGKRQNITIDETSYKCVVGDDSFFLNPIADGDGTGFSFSSSSKSIAKVTSSGEVTPLKPGVASITIKTTGSSLYDDTNVKVKVKVMPPKVRDLELTVKTSQKVGISWTAVDGVTRYEIQYGTNSQFKSKTYKTKKLTSKYLLNKFGNEAMTFSSVLSELKTGKTYYVRMRAVKTYKDDNGITACLYGEWSDISCVIPQKIVKSKSDNSNVETKDEATTEAKSKAVVMTTSNITTKTSKNNDSDKK